MESTTVNWQALDALVIDLAKSDNLIEDSSAPSPSSSPSSSSYHSRLVIRQIRRSLETGAIDAAVDLLRLHSPSILNDHRILFRLHKQEAYEEFKQVLLAFIYDKDDKTSLVANEVAVGQRLGVEEPQLMKIMRATLCTHNEWFKLQMCKDRFEGLLRIDSMKEVNTHLLQCLCPSHMPIAAQMDLLRLQYLQAPECQKMVAVQSKCLRGCHL